MDDSKKYFFNQRQAKYSSNASTVYKSTSCKLLIFPLSLCLHVCFLPLRAFQWGKGGEVWWSIRVATSSQNENKHNEKNLFFHYLRIGTREESIKVFLGLWNTSLTALTPLYSRYAYLETGSLTSGERWWHHQTGGAASESECRGRFHLHGLFWPRWTEPLQFFNQEHPPLRPIIGREIIALEAFLIWSPRRGMMFGQFLFCFLHILRKHLSLHLSKSR